MATFSRPRGSATVAGVTTVRAPIDGEVRAQVAPAAPGVSTATF
jgi:hypothetical protein